MLSGSLPAIGLPAPFSITILPKPLQPIPTAIPMRTLVFFLFVCRRHTIFFGKVMYTHFCHI